MGIFDMFNTRPATPAAPVVPAPAPIAAPAPIPAPAPTENKDPFADFQDIWSAPDPTKVSVPKPLDAPIFDPIDPKKLTDTLGTVDFSKAVPPELISAISAGGEEAAKALPQIMNAVARQTMAHSTMATNAMFEGAFREFAQRMEAKLERSYMERSTDEQVFNDNPMLRNPAVRPMIMALRSQMVAQHPNATKAEIAEKMQTYLKNFAQAFTPTNGPAPAPAPAAMNWEEWLSKG